MVRNLLNQSDESHIIECHQELTLSVAEVHEISTNAATIA